MKWYLTFLALGFGFLLILPTQSPAESPQPAKLRVGTFDSRAVAMAYYRSSDHMEYIQGLKAEYAQAKEDGDEKRMEELEALGEGSQHVAHKQGFGSWPVHDILVRIRDEIPGIAEKAGVDIIISKWELVHMREGCEFVDVTVLMAEPFDPSPETWKLIKEELPKVDPVPLEELEKHDH